MKDALGKDDAYFLNDSWGIQYLALPDGELVKITTYRDSER